MTDRIVTITLRLDDKVSGGLSDISGKIKETGDNANKAGGEGGLKGFTANLGKISTLVSAGASLWGLDQFVGALENIHAEGQRANQIETVFKALNNTDAADTLERLREATGGIVDDVTLMEGANLIKQMGLAEGGDEIAQMTEMAVKLGRAMGHDVNRSLDDFTKMLANQSILRLDTFGISSGKVRDRMAELAHQFPDMTKEMRFMTATMEEGEAALERLGDAAEVGETAMARFGTQIENIKTDVLQQVASGMEAGALALETTMSMLAPENLGKDANFLTDIFMGTGAKELAGDLAQQTEMINAAVDSWKTLKEQQELTQQVADKYGYTMEELAAIYMSAKSEGAFTLDMAQKGYLVETEADVQRVIAAYEELQAVETGQAQRDQARNAFLTFYANTMESITGYSGTVAGNFETMFDETRTARASTILKDMADIQEQMSGLMQQEADGLLTPDEAARYTQMNDDMHDLLTQAELLADQDYISKDDLKDAQDMAKSVEDMAADAQAMADAINSMNLDELLGRGSGGVSGEISDDVLAALEKRGVTGEDLTTAQAQMDLASGRETTFSQYYQENLPDLLAAIGETQGNEDMILAIQNVENAIKEGRLAGLSDAQMIDYVGEAAGYEWQTSTAPYMYGEQTLAPIGEGAGALAGMDLEPMADATTTISDNLVAADDTMSNMAGYAEDVGTLSENMSTAADDTIVVQSEVEVLQGKLDALVAKPYTIKINLAVEGGAALLGMLEGAVKDNGGKVPGADARSSGGSTPF